MSDPGWSNDWWGRDPIETAGEPPCEIFTGDEADEAFGHLTLRDPDEMRRQTAEAFRNIHDIFAAQGLWLSALIGEGK